MAKVKIISKLDYSKIKKMSKESIIQGIQYRIHGLTVKDDKWTLTNAWFTSRHGDWVLEGNESEIDNI